MGQNFDSMTIPRETKDALLVYIRENIKTAICEQTVVGQGWAGKLDASCTLLDGRTCLYDFKTQGTKPARGFNFYRDFIIQLGAYASCGQYDVVRSLCISSTEPGRIEVKEWSKAEVEWGYKIFQHMFEVFMLLNFNKSE